MYFYRICITQLEQDDSSDVVLVPPDDNVDTRTRNPDELADDESVVNNEIAA